MKNKFSTYAPSGRESIVTKSIGSRRRAQSIRVLRAAVMATPALIAANLVSTAHATPYASNVTISGTTVNFILSENADSLSYTLNGGSPIALTPTKGAGTFSLGAASDTFEIIASKSNANGYAVLTGGTIASSLNGLSVASNEGGFNLLSTDTNNFVKYNSPRGVAVNTNVNSPNFGTSYIGNSAGGTTAGRTLTDGI